MVRKVNKGLSFVEVIIALAIFMLMMVPIISSLISSMKTTGTAKELQSRNEYAQNLIETMKEVPIDALKTSTTSYLEKIGAEGVSITSNTNATYSGVDGNDYDYDEYLIKGVTYLGTERTKYSYVVEMSSKAYAVAESLNNENPNHVTSGVVQDLDKDKVALISAALSNYDITAYKELLIKKLLEVKKKKEDAGEIYDAADAANLFKDDVGNRIIEIKVSKNVSSGGYDVTCTLHYSDNSTEAVVGMADYEVYKKHFEKIPDIYLMYNLCVYNNRYAKEYITYDVSGLDSTDKVNVFVVETASDYSTSVKDADTKNVADGGNSWLKGGTDGLYQKANGMNRDNEKIGMAQVNAAGGILQVYHNMYDTGSGDNKKNLYDKTYDVTNVLHVLTGNVYVSNEEFQKKVSNMNEAQDGNRGLYEIKVWMQQGDNVDISKNPILQGTRGGGEID